jgi:DNA-binding LacI/PurR family transcriptional regulator
LRALADARIAFDERWLFPGWFTYDSGRERAVKMVERFAGEAAPTAIFCGNDAVAFGCMETLARNGIRVPARISVMGFDDSLTASATIPALTTVRQPLGQMGRTAVRLLLVMVQTPAAMSGDGPDRSTDATPSLIPDAERRVQQFPVEIVVRGSVAPPPGEPLCLHVSV